MSGFKAWIFQHGLLPRLIWPFILYNSKTRMTKKVGIAGAYIQSRHKWRANEAVLEAESRLHYKDIVGATRTGHGNNNKMDRSISPRKKKASPAGDTTTTRRDKICKGSRDGKPGKLDKMENRVERADME